MIPAVPAVSLSNVHAAASTKKQHYTVKTDLFFWQHGVAHVFRPSSMVHSLPLETTSCPATQKIPQLVSSVCPHVHTKLPLVAD
jgi:hypothetical protein